MSVDSAAVPILLYHSLRADRSPGDDPWQVSVDDFRRDIEAVASTGRTPMTATQYAGWLGGVGSSATSPVLITFDDGFADYVELALPVLQEYGMVATVFVTTGWVGRPGMMSWSLIADVAGVATEIGAHSLSHPHLDTLGDVAARAELRISREVLEEQLGDWVTATAYPHGSHSWKTRSLVRDCGYVTAHAVKNALSHRRDDVLAVARYTVRGNTTRADVMRVLEGRGVPRAWRGERIRTRLYRPVRRFRALSMIR